MQIAIVLQCVVKSNDRSAITMLRSSILTNCYFPRPGIDNTSYELSKRKSHKNTEHNKFPSYMVVDIIGSYLLHSGIHVEEDFRRRA